MSIAVSTVLLPSRILASMVSLMGALAAMAIFYVIYRLHFPWFVSTGVVAVSSAVILFVLRHFFRSRRSAWIAISDAGAIVIRIIPSNKQPEMPMEVKLSVRSRIWPDILLLHLCAGDEGIFVFPVMRDSVSPEAFRRLSVALRWIASRTAGTQAQAADMSSGNF